VEIGIKRAERSTKKKKAEKAVRKLEKKVEKKEEKIGKLEREEKAGYAIKAFVTFESLESELRMEKAYKHSFLQRCCTCCEKNKRLEQKQYDIYIDTDNVAYTTHGWKGERQLLLRISNGRTYIMENAISGLDQCALISSLLFFLSLV
jgi:hypothetical protein